MKKNKKLWEREINYFYKNETRLDYPYYIKMNYPIGSGVVEGSIKYVCNKRLKNGSPCWLLKNVSGLLKLRIIWFNNYYNEFWNWRKEKNKKKILWRAYA